MESSLTASLPGIPLDISMIQLELDRRRPGQSKLTTQRKESDSAEILSGVFEGLTTGTPIAMIIRNQDQRSQDYSAIKDIFRPGHADAGYFLKYGIRDYRGGGRSSGRETAARVAAGAVAKQILKHFNISVLAYVTRVGKITAKQFIPDTIENNPVRCADPEAAVAMAEEIRSALSERDSVGGIVECRISGVMPGLGEPAFDKLDAELAKAALSIGGVKAIEFGLGFEAASLRGSQNNDQFEHGYLSNNSGGILGGISNGEPIVFRIGGQADSIHRPAAEMLRQKRRIHPVPYYRTARPVPLPENRRRPRGNGRRRYRRYDYAQPRGKNITN